MNNSYTLTPVDGNPFSNVVLTPVEGNPFQTGIEQAAKALNNSPVAPIKKARGGSVDEKAKLNTTAEGLRMIERKLAAAMAKVARVLLYFFILC